MTISTTTRDRFNAIAMNKDAVVSDGVRDSIYALVQGASADELFTIIGNSPEFYEDPAAAWSNLGFDQIAPHILEGLWIKSKDLHLVFKAFLQPGAAEALECSDSYNEEFSNTFLAKAFADATPKEQIDLILFVLGRAGHQDSDTAFDKTEGLYLAGAMLEEMEKRHPLNTDAGIFLCYMGIGYSEIDGENEQIDCLIQGVKLLGKLFACNIRE